jgi:hypothetical protein
MGIRWERYVLGAFAPKDNANWTGPWDCAEFASWVTFQASGLLLGCHQQRRSAGTRRCLLGRELPEPRDDALLSYSPGHRFPRDRDRQIH